MIVRFHVCDSEGCAEAQWCSIGRLAVASSVTSEMPPKKLILRRI